MKLYHSIKQTFLIRKPTLLTTALTRHTKLTAFAWTSKRASSWLHPEGHMAVGRENRVKMKGWGDGSLPYSLHFYVLFASSSNFLLGYWMGAEKAHRQKMNQPRVFSVPQQNSPPAVDTGSPVLGYDWEEKNKSKRWPHPSRSYRLFCEFRKDSWQTKCRVWGGGGVERSRVLGD